MKERIWTTSALAAAVGVDPIGGADVSGIGIDSRLTEPGDLFVALAGDPGPRFKTDSRSQRDGHDFAADAVRKGAAAVLVHRPGDYGAPALVVKDTLDGLWDIGRAARRRLRGPVVAVTGSSGKTTFKSFASAVLGAFSTDGSLNNHLGVPLSLGRTPEDASCAVYEIGTNHPGEIEPLARLAQPDVAVLLNVHPAHIGNFGTVEAIRREKISIAAGLGARGVFVLPQALAADHRGSTISFGTEPGADVRLMSVAGDRADVHALGERLVCPVPGGGVHRGMSVAAVVAVLVALEVPLSRTDQLDGVHVPRGRGNRIVVAGVTIVDESYNANPTSMAATLEAFAAEPGRRVAILGDMRELGTGTARYHAELAERCAGLDGILCVGEAVRTLYTALPTGKRLGFAERADKAFAGRCASELRPGDRVLVKGSNTVFWTNGFVDMLAEELAGRG